MGHSQQHEFPKHGEIGLSNQRKRPLENYELTQDPRQNKMKKNRSKINMKKNRREGWHSAYSTNGSVHPFLKLRTAWLRESTNGNMWLETIATESYTKALVNKKAGLTLKPQFYIDGAGVSSPSSDVIKLWQVAFTKHTVISCVCCRWTSDEYH